MAPRITGVDPGLSRGAEVAFQDWGQILNKFRMILYQFLAPAHKGWGYSRPLRHPGGGGGHKACGCSTN